MSPPTTSPCKEKEAITGNVATRGRQSCAPRQTSLPAELGPMLQLVPSHAGASPSAHCTAQHSSCFAQDIFWLKGNVVLTNWSAQRVLEEKEKRKVYLGVYRMCAAHQPGEERRPKAAAKNPRLRSTKQLLQSMWMNKILVSLQA